MGCFVCEECGCIDNTALGRYWGRDSAEDRPGEALCSKCARGEWAGAFPRRKATPADADRVLNPEVIARFSPEEEGPDGTR